VSRRNRAQIGQQALLGRSRRGQTLSGSARGVSTIAGYPNVIFLSQNSNIVLE
jgi:hypothetical protein